jgi:kynurenine formamidase
VRNAARVDIRPKDMVLLGMNFTRPGRPGRNNFEVHHVCRDLGFTHVEGLINLDQVVSKGRFKFIGFSLKIRGGTASPIRAVAMVEDDRSLDKTRLCDSSAAQKSPW